MITEFSLPNGEQIVRGAKGNWEYRKNPGIAAVGIEEVRLGDVVVKERAGDWVLLDAAKAGDYPQLADLVAAAEPVAEESLLAVRATEFVGYADQVVELRSPECSHDPLIREAASAEKDRRIAEAAQERAVQRRDQALAQKRAQGETVRELADVIDLSPARLSSRLTRLERAESRNFEGSDGKDTQGA